MRLINELPEIEEKIENGSLSLSNISQVQSFFREIRKINHKDKTERQGLSNKSEKAAKIGILKRLENKSTREAEKILLELNPKAINLKEKERILSNELTEVRFVVTEELKQKLEELRSLLGPKGSFLSFSELVGEITDIGIEALRKKRFGCRSSKLLKADSQKSDPLTRTPAPELRPRRKENDLDSDDANKSHSSSVKSKGLESKTRYISKPLKTQIWIRDKGECQICKSKRNLNFDHIRPYALGGESTEENLRLLCYHCNQRQAIKKFGFEKIKTYHSQRP